MAWNALGFDDVGLVKISWKLVRWLDLYGSTKVGKNDDEGHSFLALVCGTLVLSPVV